MRKLLAVIALLCLGADYPRDPNIPWKKYEPTRSITTGYGPVLDDLEAHAKPGHPMRNTRDPGSWVHELTHHVCVQLVNQEYAAGTFEDGQCVYVGDGYGLAFAEPNITLTQVGNEVRKKGSAFDVVFGMMLRWWANRPAYVLQESNAYTNALWYYVHAGKKHDWRLSKAQEMLDYTDAFIRAVEKHDSDYPQLELAKKYVAWNRKRVEHLTRLYHGEPEPAPPSDDYDVMKMQDPEELQGYVEYLADDAREGRMTASKGLRDAQEYVKSQLKEAGIPVFEQPVSTSQGSCKNIIGFIKGAMPDTYIVVGAHLDHMGRSRAGVMNGADDNASGSAAILGLAKRLNKIKPLRSIVFVWFTGEEISPYLTGSKAFVKRPFDGDFDLGNKLPVFMLNLDMVGHLSDNIKARRVTEPKNLEPLFEKYDFAQRITYREGASDNMSFSDKGVPVIFLITGTHGRYHTTSDDPDTLDYPGMSKVCDYAYDMILFVVGKTDDYDLLKGS